MSFASTGSISVNTLRTAYGLTGQVGISVVRGWSGTSASGSLGLSAFRGKPQRSRYPPTDIVAGNLWTKDVNDTFVGIDQTYRKFKYTIPNTVTYGAGLYVAYSNGHFQYLNGDTYNADEWPPSGAFDNRIALSGAKAGWHTINGYTYTSTADAATPPVLYIELPFATTLLSYTLQCRSDCCTGQPPSKWNVEGSNNRTAWTLLDSRSGDTVWTTSQTKTYTISNNRTAFQYYRIIVYRNSQSTGTNMHIGEWALYCAQYRN